MAQNQPPYCSTDFFFQDIPAQRYSSQWNVFVGSGMEDMDSYRSQPAV